MTKIELIYSIVGASGWAILVTGALLSWFTVTRTDPGASPGVERDVTPPPGPSTPWSRGQGLRGDRRSDRRVDPRKKRERNREPATFARPAQA